MSSTHLSRVGSPVTSRLTPSVVALRVSGLEEVGVTGVATDAVDAFLPADPHN